jgi:hypothetical protein
MSVKQGKNSILCKIKYCKIYLTVKKSNVINTKIEL